MEEVIYASATTLTRRIRDRELSSEEVIEAHLWRIEAVNKQLNAVVQVAADEALAAARAADTALAQRRPPGPLAPARAAGNAVTFEPGEEHWHDASPTTAMTHVAIQEALDGKAVTWMEHVTDEQYLT